MTYQYSAHEQLEEDWRSGRLTPVEEISECLSPHVEELARRIEAGRRLIPIQGRVSDYKSWLAADLARALSEEGMSVTIFAPQRTNRESSTEKLEMFGADYVEHPGRIDLCNWEPWRDNVGHVDKTTCSSIGCPFYLQNEEDIAERSAEGLSSHRMVEAGTKLDAGAMREIGSREQQDFCPAQFHNEIRASDALSDAVNTATYAKAFEDAAVSPDDPLDSDVLLMDEAHTIAAEPDAVTDTLEPGSLLGSLSTLIGTLEDSPERWAARALEDIEGLRDAASHWLENSSDGRADPDDIFAGRTVGLGDAFTVLERIEGRLQQNMRRAASRNDWSAAKRRAEPYHAVQSVRAFLSNVKSYRDGDVDFVHSLYEQQGELVNEMAFRSVDESVDPLGGTTPGAVFEEWQDSGTHPAIRQRWGPLLDRHIESLWEGRSVLVGDDDRTMPGAPVRPMDRLEEITGSSTTITLSATHNELSDPTRDPGTLRPTRHRLLAAPVYLRASGSERADYDGAGSVSPDTPWFVEMVTRAKETSGDSLAAVPINFRNREKWKAMPVEPLEPGGEEMAGVVPHSRGSIGAKELESMDIDCVLCGVQVQSPAPTARRLVQWWEMLAPRYDDPADVLEDSWRLLAQHAVSGTIQAGGRFDWDAVNLVFERPGLLELAGFEHGVAGPESPGFAGEFCRLYEDVDGEWADRRDANRAARVVAYLNKQDRKTASGRQVVGTYQRWYDAGGEAARRALWLAVDRGRVEPRDERTKTTYRKT
jgi:hypothetical protein